VEKESLAWLALDISHGDKQSITIMIMLDTPSDPRIDSLETQAVIREALRRQRRRQRRIVGILLLVLLSCGALAVVVGHGGGGRQGAQSHGRELRPGSSRASPLVPGSPQALSARQFILTQAAVKIAVDGLGSSGNVTIPAVAQQWTNNQVTCLQVAFGAPDFPSAALRSEWTESGLSVTALKGQPQGFCVENVPGGGALAGPSAPSPSQSGILLAQGLGAIDVAGLSTNPSTLARDLEQGRTGSVALDRAVAQRTVASPGFERALLLLCSPKLGESTAFRSALLQSLPLIHGVVRLGHALGRDGVQFAAGTGPGSPTVILDARSGQLIEARNFAAGSLYRSVGMISFWNPYAISSGGVGSQEISLTMVGFNPVGDQAVVSSAPAFGFPI
jgi:hypothetical protein